MATTRNFDFLDLINPSWRDALRGLEDLRLVRVSYGKYDEVLRVTIQKQTSGRAR